MRNMVAIAVVAAALAGAAWAQEHPKEGTMATKLIEAGAEAPDFRLNDETGKAVKLSGFRGKKWVVLAFYPKALTGG